MVGKPVGLTLLATGLPLRLELRSIGEAFSLPPLPVRLKLRSVGLPLRLPPFSKRPVDRWLGCEERYSAGSRR